MIAEVSPGSSAARRLRTNSVIELPAVRREGVRRVVELRIDVRLACSTNRVTATYDHRDTIEA